ncbi:MAG: PilN domain-containing protein [Candidatus Dactylopiibacterium sp.]|nr:PilN domain-containing protein [Candidatus Dactylopiibacterium sp.]
MIRINLLPHREQARKARKQQFVSLSVLTVLLGGVIWFVGSTLIGARIDAQNSSNDFLKREIAALDKEISEIARLKEQTQSLLARKQVIEALQANRAETVTFFNELVKQMPEGVFIKQFKQTGKRITFTGLSQSNARVSQLMRNLDASPIFEKPALQEIKSASYKDRVVGEFILAVDVESAPVAEASAPAVAAKGGQ